MRKMTFALVLVIFAVFGLLAGCGGGAGNTGTTLATPSLQISKLQKTMKITISLDADGNIMDLQDLGTMKYKASDIDMVMYVSDRQYAEVAPTVAGSTVSVFFTGIINNDRPQVIFLMDDGEQYPVLNTALTFSSDVPMQFFPREWDFEYGKQEETYVDATLNNDNTMDLNVYFGCDKLVGLQEDVLNPLLIGGVAWEKEDGSIIPAALKQNKFGSYYANVKNIPLVQQSDAPSWQGPSTTGRLVVYSKSGLRTPLLRDFWSYQYDWNALQYNYPYSEDGPKADLLMFYIRMN